MALFGSLRHRPFALLWCGQALSRLGDSLYRVALAWWVLEKTGSAGAMGKVLFCSNAPLLLLLLVGGVAVDRLHRVKLMLASDAVRGAVVTAVALLAWSHRLEVWHVYVAGAVFGTVNAFFHPAYAVIVPEIVPGESLPSANSLTALGKQTADIAGPAFSAAVVALGGAALAFAINAATFFVSAACLVPLLRVASLRGLHGETAGVLGDLREGLRTVAGTRWVWFTIVAASVGNMALNGPLFVSLPTLVKRDAGAGVGALGVAYSSLALGSVIAAARLGHNAALRARGAVGYGAWLACGLALTLCGAWASLPGVWSGAFVCGATTMAFGLIWTNALQEKVPRAALGRVASIDLFGTYCMLPLGFWLAGWATDRVGARAVFLFGGCAIVLLSALGLSQREIRRLD